MNTNPSGRHTATEWTDPVAPCGAVLPATYGLLPCDLERGHEGPHRCYDASGAVLFGNDFAIQRPATPDTEILLALPPILQAAVRGDALTDDERDMAHAAFYALPRIAARLTAHAVMQPHD